MYTCISFLAIFSLAEESKSYRLDNMNESYDDNTGNNKSTGGGGGGGGEVNSALIQYCICSFPVIAPKYFISLQHSCELSLRMVFSFSGRIDGHGRLVTDTLFGLS